jgi:hypothetical protein
MIIFDLFEDKTVLKELAPPEDHNWDDGELDDDPVGRAAYRAAMTIKAWRMDRKTAIKTLARYPQLIAQLKILEPAILTNKQEFKELLDWAVTQSRMSDASMMDISDEDDDELDEEFDLIESIIEGLDEAGSPAQPADINDTWFEQGAFQTYKKAAPVKYTVPGQPGTVKTLEGPMKYSAQARIITGPKGEQYPVEPAKFAELYDDNGDGTATPKKILKVAKLADHDGVLHTSWGDLQYTAGNDYIVRHGANDYGAVKKDIFAQTYALPQGVAEGKDDNYYRVEQRDRNGKLQGVYHKSSLNYPLQNIVSDCAHYQKQNPSSTFQLFVDGQPADWKKLYQQAKQQDMAEDSNNFRAKSVPDINRSLPGIPSAPQAFHQFANLKQNQPYIQRLQPSPTGHLQIAVENLRTIPKKDGGLIIKGNTVDTSRRQAYTKPWVIEVDRDGNIVAQNLDRLNDDELAVVEFNLVVRNRILKPNQIARAVAESRVLGEKRQAKTAHDPVSDPLLNYTGVNHRVKSLLKKARAENPGARNDIEAVFAHVASGDSLDQQQEQRLQQQQQQIADLAEKLIQSQENYNKQELRFQQLNDKIRRQGGQATAQDVANAQAADQIARQGMTEDDEEHRPIPAKSIIQGYTVFWDPETRMAYITKGGHDKEASLAHVKIATPIYKNFINGVTRSIDQLDQELSGDLAESLRPGEYHVWTVHLNDGTQRRFRVPSDEYPDERIKAYYARKGKQVVKIDYDWAVHSDHMDENNQGPEYRAVKPVPANYGGGHRQGQPQKINYNSKPSAPIRGRTIKAEPVAVKETKPLSARERLQQEVDRIKKQEQELRTGLTGLDHERVQQQLKGIGRRMDPKKTNEDKDTEGVERAILHRIMVGHKDLLLKYGPKKVMQAAEEVAYNVGDISEIGTSDVSSWVRQVEQILGAVSEAAKTVDEAWSAKYKRSINCSHPRGFSQRAHCAGKRKHNESVDMEMTCPDCGMCETHAEFAKTNLDEACWPGYHKEGMKTMFGKRYPNCKKNKKKMSEDISAKDIHDLADRKGIPWDNNAEFMRMTERLTGKQHLDDLNPQQLLAVKQHLDKQDIAEEKCPHCGGLMVSEERIAEKQDACYYKVKSRYKVWPSAYASGALVQCRKKGAANWGNKSESTETQPDLDRIVELGTGMRLSERTELIEEFDLIERIIDDLAQRNSVDAEVIWEDLESLTDDELYVFATTSTIMETEAWQRANNRDRTAGMSRGAVKTYRREHPGSKLQTAVTTKPSKLKRGSKASKRRKSYCSRSRGQMKMHNISCAKTPDKAICKARRRWNC